MLVGKNVYGTVGVMLGVPFNHAEFTWSLVQMMEYSREYACSNGQIIHLAKSSTSYHASARNELVQQMLGDWLFMLDTDHMFGPDMLARLLCIMNSYPDIDVLSAMYYQRAYPYAPVMFMWNDKKTGFSRLSDWVKTTEDGLPTRFFEIDSCGAGSLLIKRSVFDRIYNELNEEPFSIIPPFSEDHSFFARLNKLGIKAYCAPNIQSLHLETRPISTELYTERFAPLQGPSREVRAG